MVDTSISGMLIIFSHIIPAIAGFIGVLLICTGIMDRKFPYTVAGIVLFFVAGLLPFVILSSILGI